MRPRQLHPVRPPVKHRVVRVWLRDLLAGGSVALVLVPQALAYAELAGLNAVVGLIAAGLPLIVAAPMASSPYLQTGPTAMIALLTFGILSSLYPAYTPEYAAAAALLALTVGLIRMGLGLARFGAVAYFMSQPVMQGFSSAAALLIILSQLPAAVGTTTTLPNPTLGFLDTVGHPGRWDPWSIAFTAATVLVVNISQRVSPLLPGVLATVVLGVIASSLLGYQGPTVGMVDSQWVQLDLILPWRDLPHLLLGAMVIAIVGFAEPAAIARAYAGRQAWDPDRELVSQGAANLVAGALGAFPVGGSFSRSALNHAAGAVTRWSGLITGVAVLAVLPFVGLLAELPKAVLAGVVIGAVSRLLRLQSLLRLWRYARLQALTAYITFLLTLALAPRIDVAVVIGIGLAIAAHLYREMDLGIATRQEGDVLVLRLTGVLWFGSTHLLEECMLELFPPPDEVVKLRVDATALGRVDLSGALVLDALLSEAERHRLALDVVGLRPHMKRVLDRIRES
ncbi:MAG: SulP family inorganic anion transporter [Trueperaceae bacterium]